MTSNRIPKPPVSGSPILVSAQPRQSKARIVLEQFLDAHAAGDIDQAANCALAALASTLEAPIVESLVGLANDLAVTQDYHSTGVTQLLCNAADRGLLQHAYNAANRVMSDAKSPDDFKVAEHYFRLAMSFREKPELQAAAHVNFCPIVRDGLISGKPDWPAAVEIYEAAARMGLIKAMFNAGNVSDWLAAQGNREYGARAAYWFQYALDYRASGKPTLDMDTPAELEGVFQQCRVALSGCHIDARFDGADLEEGIRWAKEAVSLGSTEARHNLGIGYTRRLAKMTTPPQRLPGANWRSVLSQMDWSFSGGVETIVRTLRGEKGAQVPVELDKLTVQLADGSTIPLYVTHHPCLPCFGGGDIIQAIAENLARSGNPAGFLLLPRKAVFVQEGNSPFTPIYAYSQGEFGMQALGMVSSPDQVLQDLQDGIEFIDTRLPTWTCMIPIAVNALDEGFVVASSTTFRQPYATVGGPFRMPFVSKEKLQALGL